MNVVLCIGKRQGLEALEFLLAQPDVNVTTVFPVKEAPHERSAEAERILSLCEEHGIRVSAERAESLLEEGSAPDLILAIKWRHLFSERLLGHPKLGTFVIHDSLLPEYRGASPLNWALINGEAKTGATLFRAVSEMDAGPIVSQRSFALESSDDYASADEKMIACYAELVAELHRQVRDDRLKLTPQDESRASYCCRRSPEDGLVDWRQSATQIHNLIRALSPPAPGAFTTLKGAKLTLWRSRVLQAEDGYVGRVPGKPIRVDRERGRVEILCGSGVLEVGEVQLGDERAPASRFITSIGTTLGARN